MPLSKLGLVDKAVGMLEHMKKAELVPNSVTYESVMQVL